MGLAERVIESLDGSRPLSNRDRRAVRSSAAIVDGNRRVGAQCDDCAIFFAIAPETLRDRRKAGKTIICPRCSGVSRIKVTSTHRNFWKKPQQDPVSGRLLHEGFDDGWIVEVAEGIWGPRDEWQ